MTTWGYCISKNCAWSKHGSYFQWGNLRSFQREAVQIAKEGKEYLRFPTLRLQMSHRATICICRRFPSFCMHAHPGNISKHYSTLPQCFITRHKFDTVLSLARKCSRLSIRFCQQEKRNCYSPEVARETYLQVLQICRGKAPVERQTWDTHKLMSCWFLCILSCAPLLGTRPSWAKPQECFSGQWRSNSDAQNGRGNGSCTLSNLHHQVFCVCHPRRWVTSVTWIIWSPHFAFLLGRPRAS